MSPLCCLLAKLFEVTDLNFVMYRRGIGEGTALVSFSDLLHRTITLATDQTNTVLLYTLETTGERPYFLGAGA